MFSPNRFCPWLLGLTVLFTASANAGMTVITLRDIAESRIESISFFIFLYLLLALAVKALWNYLARSFPWMPRINFRRALCMMLVSGLFLYVILTMISGARELLTPGAWEKKGIGYKLKNDPDLNAQKRNQKLKDLHTDLQVYADEHDGFFPLSLNQIGSENIIYQYAYLSGHKQTDGKKILVYERAQTNGKQMVLYCDGSMEELRSRQIATMIRKEKGDQ